MSKKSEASELLSVLMEDIRGSLKYTPNRDADLLCIMEQYIKGDAASRPELLEQLRACLDGEPYDNPFLAYNHYDETTANLLESILKSGVKNMALAADPAAVLARTIEHINSLHSGSRGTLLDNWRGLRLEKLLCIAAHKAGLQDADRLLRAQKQW